MGESIYWRGRGRNYPIIKARRNPRRNTNAIFKYREDFITATFKTVMNVTFLGPFHNRNKIQCFHRFASAEEETRKRPVTPNAPQKLPRPGVKNVTVSRVFRKRVGQVEKANWEPQRCGEEHSKHVGLSSNGESSQIRAYCSNHISNEINEIKTWSPETAVAVCPGRTRGVLSIYAPPKRSGVENDVCPPKQSGVENNVKEAFKTHHWDYSTF